jgi:hypothetical protein
MQDVKRLTQVNKNRNIYFKLVQLLNNVSIFNFVCTSVFCVTSRKKLDPTYICLEEFYFSSNLSVMHARRFIKEVTTTKVATE